MVTIIDTLEQLEDHITIEYYNHSKIIKSIDGIEKFNNTKFQERIDILKAEQKRKIEQEKIQKEIAKKEQEEQKKLETKEFLIKQNAVGKNIEEVKKELAEIHVFEIPIQYIRSKFYSVGTVAFVERGGKNFTLTTLYVVKDNSDEDLTTMPQLKQGMSKEEIIERLNQQELNYEFHIKEANTAFEKKLHGLYSCTPPGIGTYIPKGSIVRLTIYDF